MLGRTDPSPCFEKKDQILIFNMGQAPSLIESRDVVESWDVETLSNNLKEKGMGDYAEKFRVNVIDGIAALLLEESDLVEMGFTSGLDRKRVMAAIKRVHLNSSSEISRYPNYEARNILSSLPSPAPSTNLANRVCPTCTRSACCTQRLSFPG